MPPGCSSDACPAPPPPRPARRAGLDLIRNRAMTHREDLKATRVGDDWPLPAHEGADAAKPLDQLRAGVEQQVEGVAQHHLIPQRGNLLGQQAFDGGLRRERHERGRAHVAPVGVQRRGAGPRRWIAGFDGESGHRGIASKCLTPTATQKLHHARLPDRRQPPGRSLGLPDPLPAGDGRVGRRAGAGRDRADRRAGCWPAGAKCRSSW